jgi:hypothetical protein
MHLSFEAEHALNDVGVTSFAVRCDDVIAARLQAIANHG